jgi:hypothetical protein
MEMKQSMKPRVCERMGCVYCPRKRSKECKCPSQKANVKKCDCGLNQKKSK